MKKMSQRNFSIAFILLLGLFLMLFGLYSPFWFTETFLPENWKDMWYFIPYTTTCFFVACFFIAAGAGLISLGIDEIQNYE